MAGKEINVLMEGYLKKILLLDGYKFQKKSLILWNLWKNSDDAKVCKINFYCFNCLNI